MELHKQNLKQVINKIRNQFDENSMFHGLNLEDLIDIDADKNFFMLPNAFRSVAMRATDSCLFEFEATR